MDSLHLIVRHLETWWAHASRCAQSPISAPVCSEFRTWAGVAAAVGVFIVIWKTTKYLTAVLVARRHRADMARVADEETMARYRADIDKLHAGSQDEDVEQRIRLALDERKLKDQWQRPGATGKKENG